MIMELSASALLVPAVTGVSSEFSPITREVVPLTHEGEFDQRTIRN